MRALFTAIACVTVISISAHAYAFEPAPGVRAYPLSGTDMVSGRWVDLEDYRGKWVLLEFWGSW